MELTRVAKAARRTGAGAVGFLALAVVLWSARAAAGTGAAAGSAAAPATAAQPPVTAWEELRRTARAAHDAKDFAGYRAALGRLFELLGGYPDIVFATAKAEALLGHSSTALEWLDAYAAMGLVREVASEPDFAALRQVAGFAAVQARIEGNRRSVSRSVHALSLADPDLLTEDIAYDEARHRFLVSSIRQAKIVAVDARTGAASDFVPAGRDPIWGILALAVDAPRGVLWATTAGMPQTRGFRAQDRGHSAVLRYDLATGALLARYDLPLPPDVRPSPTSSAQGYVPAPDEERDRVLGDMTLGPGGEVFVSEAVTGAVYTLPREGRALQVLVAPGTFISPQNPAVTPDGRRLLVADYVRGIGVVDLAGPAHGVTWMPHPREVAVNGIDGMYLVGSTLIAVQNGTEPHRVARFDLDPSLTHIERWQALDSNSPGLGEPTHGTVSGRDFFFLANSGWDRFADDGSVKPGAVATPAEVRRVTL